MLLVGWCSIVDYTSRNWIFVLKLELDGWVLKLNLGSQRAMDSKGKQVKEGGSNACLTRKERRTEMTKLERRMVSIADSQRGWFNAQNEKLDAMISALQETGSDRIRNLKTQFPPPPGPCKYTNEIEARIARFNDESDEDEMKLIDIDCDSEEEEAPKLKPGCDEVGANELLHDCDSEAEDVYQEPRGVVKRGRGRPRKFRGKAGSSGAR